MSARWLRSGIPLGLALGPDRVTGVRLDQPRRGCVGDAWSQPAQLGVGVSAGELETILAELASGLKISRASVAIALLPPLVELKRLALPPIRAIDLERVVARDAGRYFLRAATPQVVGVADRSKTEGGGFRLAAAADALLVAQVYQAIEKLGWSVRHVVPAQAAWAAFACEVGCGGAAAVLVALSDRATHVMLFERGRLAGFRQLSPQADDETVLRTCATWLAGAAPKVPLVVVGTPTRRNALAALAPTYGFEGVPLESAVTGHDVEALAAAFAWRARGPGLVPELVVRSQEGRVRNIARTLGLAAALLLALAGGLEWWGLERELGQITARRRAVHREVAEAMAVRGALDSLDDRLRGLRAAEASRIRWSSALATVTAAVPADGHLVSWYGRQDTLRLEGEASRAADVFGALQRAGAFQAVRADAPIRQELRDSAPPVEHFIVTTRLGAGQAGATR